ncbi:hypothetical protein [Methylocaldum gracile]|jgi:hypothetical protein|uniref:hypothetical protein n=1 Tax=Methylocaldum sp. 0917 TaxID=2485163 RepID=UPI00105B7F36
MSGFVQRLVGRAMGLTKSVHAAARLPYAPPPALVEPELPEAVLPNSAVSGDGRSARREAAGDPVRRLDVPENVPGKRTFEASVTDHTAFVPDAPRASIRPPPFTASPERDGYAAPATAEMGQAGFADEESPAESVADLMPRSSRGAIDADFADREGRVNVRGLAHMVEPLFPPQRAMHSPAWNARNRPPDSSRGPASASGAGEATEVHVTIGRIEVTAVHEAPPSKRRAPPSAKPMTLEEYLARRRGERP